MIKPILQPRKLEVMPQRKSHGNKLPPDEHIPDPKKQKRYRVQIDLDHSITAQVVRKGELGLPHVDFRVMAHNKKYNGLTEQGFTLPLNVFREFMGMAYKVYEKCDERDWFSEWLKEVE